MNSTEELKQQEIQIRELTREQLFLNEAIEDTGLDASMYYYNFIVLVIVCLFLIILTIKVSLGINGQRDGGDRNYNGYLLLLSIFILILIVSYFFK